MIRQTASDATSGIGESGENTLARLAQEVETAPLHCLVVSERPALCSYLACGERQRLEEHSVS
jgi:hypothetical protein